MDAARPILPPHPPRRRRASFVLTSLIDVIFLLVIFFMVTSQITPFSLIPLGPVATEGAGAPPVADLATSPPVSLRILAGAVSIGGKRVPMAEIGEALSRLRQGGVGALVVSSSTAATVQDLVTVLEATRAAAFADVVVINRRAEAP
jgi:biopolymer transport protein ExbD